MQNVLEVKNLTLPQLILGRLHSEMAQIKPTYAEYKESFV
jgi:hypothetical protein